MIMLREDNELLLKDLSARLPYGVIVLSSLGYVMSLTLEEMKSFDGGYRLPKPYLRSLSSMTDADEEEAEWNDLMIRPLLENACDSLPRSASLGLYAQSQYLPLDYLHKHHFDYRGLIPRGLAIEVTPENNPYKI